MKEKCVNNNLINKLNVSVFVFVMMILFGTSAVTTNASNLNEDIIPDEGLAMCISESDLGEDLFDKDLTLDEFVAMAENVSSLTCDSDDYQIESLAGLEYFTNLQYLIINNLADDVQEIPAEINTLSNLLILDLDDNNINTISNVNKLTNLRGLSLNNNVITEISGIRGLVNLDSLLLDDNYIVDLSSLSNLPISIESVSMADQYTSDYQVMWLSFEEIFGRENADNDISALDLSIDGGEYSEYIDNPNVDYWTVYGLEVVGGAENFSLLPNPIVDFTYSLVAEVYGFDPLEAVDAEVHVSEAAQTEDVLFDQMEVYAGGILDQDVTDHVVITNLDGYDFTDPKVGTYEIEFTLNDFTIDGRMGDQTYTATYTVYGDTLISTSDASVAISGAPTSIYDLLVALQAELTENGSQVDIADYLANIDVVIEGYDFENPVAGTYDVIVTYTNSQEDVYTSESTLEVTEDSSEVIIDDNTDTDDTTPTIETDPSIQDTGISYGIYTIAGLMLLIVVGFLSKNRIK